MRITLEGAILTGTYRMGMFNNFTCMQQVAVPIQRVINQQPEYDAELKSDR
ncbi:MAG: hypothetical protein ACKO1F_09105 [Flammeovirgaceae bacterium]